MHGYVRKALFIQSMHNANIQFKMIHKYSMSFPCLKEFQINLRMWYMITKHSYRQDASLTLSTLKVEAKNKKDEQKQIRIIFTWNVENPFWMWC